jgi:DNA-directed RNA polymerase specialized sigma24 family protein
MLTSGVTHLQSNGLMAQARPIARVPELTENDLWFYRTLTVRLLRRYARISTTMGRLPSVLNCEPTRSRPHSYNKRKFEDLMIFVTDMDRALEQLSDWERKLLAINIIEDYTTAEVARMLAFPLRTIERQIHAAIDSLSRVMEKRGMLEE